MKIGADEGVDLHRVEVFGPKAVRQFGAYLLQHFAFCPTEDKPVYPLAGGAPRTMANFREEFNWASMEVTGPRGGVKKVHPVDFWRTAGDHVQIIGERFSPLSCDHLIEVRSAVTPSHRDYAQLMGHGGAAPLQGYGQPSVPNVPAQGHTEPAPQTQTAQTPAKGRRCEMADWTPSLA